MCKKYKSYFYYQHHCAHIRNVFMHVYLTPKGIYTKLSVSHQYIKQMGPTYVKWHEQNVPRELSHALTWDDDSLYWSPLLIPYGRRVFRLESNSSLSLSWFDLSTPGYDLSNKAWRGWGIKATKHGVVEDQSEQIEPGKRDRAIGSDVWTLYGHMGSNKVDQ